MKAQKPLNLSPNQIRLLRTRGIKIEANPFRAFERSLASQIAEEAEGIGQFMGKNVELGIA